MCASLSPVRELWLGVHSLTKRDCNGQVDIITAEVILYFAVLWEDSYVKEDPDSAWRASHTRGAVWTDLDDRGPLLRSD